MSDIERRLREDLSATAGAVDTLAPPFEPVLAESTARREQRRSAAGAGAGLVLLVAVTLTIVATNAREKTEADPERSGTARLAVDSATTTIPPTPTTRPRPAPSPTTPRPQPIPSPTTVPETTTTTTDPRPLAQRVPKGLWVVGLDGRNLRRVGEVGRYAWSPDGSRLAVATDRISILSAVDGRSLSTIESAPTSGAKVSCLDWSSTGQLGWITTDGAVRYASASDRAGTFVGTVPGPLDPLGYLADGCRWSPDGSLFAAPGDGLTLFDAAGRRVPVHTDDAEADQPIGRTTSPVWAPDGRSIALLGQADTVAPKAVVLSGEDWAHAVTVPGTNGVLRLAWATDGRKLFVTEESRVSSFDVARGTSTVEATTCCLGGLTPLGGGDFVTFGQGDAVRFVSSSWQPRGGLLTADAPANRCEGTFFATVRLAPDGRELAVEAQPMAGVQCPDVRPSP